MTMQLRHNDDNQVRGAIPSSFIQSQFLRPQGTFSPETFMEIPADIPTYLRMHAMELANEF